MFLAKHAADAGDRWVLSSYSFFRWGAAPRMSLERGRPARGPPLGVVGVRPAAPDSARLPGPAPCMPLPRARTPGDIPASPAPAGFTPSLKPLAPALPTTLLIHSPAARTRTHTCARARTRPPAPPGCTA